MASPPHLVLRDRRLVFSKPALMGVVNASPESFSDGALVGGAEVQERRAMEMVEAGAGIIDVGGESGVTNREPISVEEEIRRVVPLVERLAARNVVVSVDTWKAPVARAALDAGAAIINDVSGLRDPDIARACGEHGAGLVVMHTRAAPKRKEFPRYDDVVADVLSFLAAKIEEAVTLGVGEESIVVDPGPDFAKTPAQTIAVLRRLPDVVALGHPVLLAVSRKDFVGALTRRRPSERLAGTLAAVGEGVDAGAAILRVHDVGPVNDFLAVWAALRGGEGVADDLNLAEHLRREA